MFDVVVIFIDHLVDESVWKFIILTVGGLVVLFIVSLFVIFLDMFVFIVVTIMVANPFRIDLLLNRIRPLFKGANHIREIYVFRRMRAQWFIRVCSLESTDNRVLDIWITCFTIDDSDKPVI